MNIERQLLRELVEELKTSYSEDYDYAKSIIYKVEKELDKPELEPDFYISKSSTDLIANGIRPWCDCVIFKNKPSKPDQVYIPIYLSPQTQNLELSIAVKAMRDQALYNENWYTFIPCEFSENVDTALNNITGE